MYWNFIIHLEVIQNLNQICCQLQSILHTPPLSALFLILLWNFSSTKNEIYRKKIRFCLKKCKNILSKSKIIKITYRITSVCKEDIQQWNIRRLLFLVNDVVHLIFFSNIDAIWGLFCINLEFCTFTYRLKLSITF